MLQEGKTFEVICVDARPDISGENLCARLLDNGIKCSYMALNALPHMIGKASKVLLGASAVKSNGTAVAKAGSALVAMAASNAQKPLLICAQSIKFHDEVQLEAITSNERGDPRVCTSMQTYVGIYEFSLSILSFAAVLQDILTVRYRPDLSAKLTASSESGTLSVLNLIYDVMPIDFITLIVTEFGLIPPTSVPVILREKRDDEALLMAK